MIKVGERGGGGQSKEVEKRTEIKTQQGKRQTSRKLVLSWRRR